MDQKEALTALKAGDHAIFTVEHGQAIAGAFGIHAPVQTFADTRHELKGITLDGRPEGDTADGVDAARLAVHICDALGVEYAPMSGIGSRLRSCCEAIEGAVA